MQLKNGIAGVAQRFIQLKNWIAKVALRFDLFKNQILRCVSLLLKNFVLSCAALQSIQKKCPPLETTSQFAQLHQMRKQKITDILRFHCP